jgi:hypothetical protein
MPDTRITLESGEVTVVMSGGPVIALSGRGRAAQLRAIRTILTPEQDARVGEWLEQVAAGLETAGPKRNRIEKALEHIDRKMVPGCKPDLKLRREAAEQGGITLDHLNRVLRGMGLLN